MLKKFVLILSITLLIFSYSLITINVSGSTEDYEYWQATIVQSNSTWPILMVYNPLDVFYQDLYLVSRLNNTERIANCQAQFKGHNGTLGHNWTYSYYDDDYFSSNFVLYQLELNSSFKIKPQEFDRNFYMFVEVNIVNQSSIIYNENHTFWIVGEPEVTREGGNIFEGIDIAKIYLMSLAITGTAIGMTCFIKFIIKKKWRQIE